MGFDQFIKFVVISWGKIPIYQENKNIGTVIENSPPFFPEGTPVDSLGLFAFEFCKFADSDILKTYYLLVVVRWEFYTK